MDFPEALALVLDLEGGKSDDPRDSGGRTNHGITQRVYDSYCDRVKKPHQDVFLIPMIDVEAIYKHDYWLAAGCDRLPGRLAVSHFQAAVLMGVAGAGRILDAVRWDDAPEDYIDYAYLTLQREKLKSIAVTKEGNKAFLGGWMNRVNKTWAFVRLTA